MLSKLYQKLLWAAFLLLWLTSCDGLRGVSRGLQGFRLPLPGIK
ncbi:MAG: hypothetical protein ACM3PY_19085 [Omnitrophica WOR_2 bacterium]